VLEQYTALSEPVELELVEYRVGAWCVCRMMSVRMC